MMAERIILQDGSGIHKGDVVRKLNEARGASLWFLPAYSLPDLNSVKETFPKIEALLRRAATHARDALVDVSGEVLDAVGRSDAKVRLARRDCGLRARLL